MPRKRVPVPVQYDPRTVPRIPRQTDGCESCFVNWAYAWDHCHKHGWVRGKVCGQCNNLYGALDLGDRLPFCDDDAVNRWVEWVARCPDCLPITAEDIAGLRATAPASDMCMSGRHAMTPDNLITGTNIRNGRPWKTCKACYAERVKNPTDSNRSLT